MKKMIISPFPKSLSIDKPSAKMYPYWPQVIGFLKAAGIYTIQIGGTGEPSLGCDEEQFGKSFRELKDLTDSSDGWISVDNFFQHFVHYHKLKSGIVIWSKSDPNIFGYPENINILKDRKYLRKEQFKTWNDEPHELESFNTAQEVFHITQPYLNADSVIMMDI